LCNTRLSNFTAAYLDLNTAIDLGITEKEAYFQKAVVEIELEKYFEAIDDLNYYLAAHPLAYEAFFYRGIANHKSGNYQTALEDFNKSIELNPNHERAYFERAFVKKSLQDQIGYSNDLKTAYNKGYLYAYHYLKEV
jgi:tetratricopeptide (TPR) repeat protein